MYHRRHNDVILPLGARWAIAEKFTFLPFIGSGVRNRKQNQQFYFFFSFMFLLSYICFYPLFVIQLVSISAMTNKPVCYVCFCQMSWTHIAVGIFKLLVHKADKSVP